MDALWRVLSEAIGSEEPNLHLKDVKLKDGATAAQREAWERTYLFDEETGQHIHRAALLARASAAARDATPGAGRLGRYMKGLRYAIIAEDKDGTGFEYGEVYQVHVDNEGKLLGKHEGELVLEGDVRVGHVRVLELRKLCGNVQHPRLSVKQADAALGFAVVLPLLPRDGQPQAHAADRASAPPKLVPLLGLGRKVELQERAGEESVYTIGEAAKACGGPKLKPLSLDPEWFARSAMETQADLAEKSTDLRRMKQTELAGELKARRAPQSGRKGVLQQRLRALIITENAAADDE